MPDIASLSIRIDSSDAKKGVDNLGGLTTAAEKSEAAVSAFEQEFEKLAAELRQTNALLQEQARYMQAFAEQTRLGSASTDKLGEEVARATAAIAQQAAQMNALAGAMLTAAPAEREVERETRQVAAAARSSGEAMVSMESRVASLVARFAGFAAVTAEMKRTVSAALDFGSAMAEVKTVADQSTDLSRTAEELKQLSVQFGSAPTQEARALYQVISAGVSDTAKAMDILTVSNKLAVGGLTDVFTAADGLTSVLAVYGDQVRDAQQASDMMFVAAADGKTRIEELAHSLGMITSIAKPAGLGLDELLASTAALTKIMPTTMAVEGLRSALSQVIGPSEQARKVAAQLGIDFSIAGVKAHGFGAFLQEVQEKTHGSPELMKQLFQDVQAVNAALSLAGPLADSYATSMEHMGASVGKTNEAFKTMADTPAFQLKQLKEQFAVLETNVGDGLVSGLLPAVRGLSENFEQVTSAAGHLAGAIGLIAASRFGSTVVSWVQAQAQQIAATQAASAATVEAALGQAAYTRAAGESASAAIASARAELAVRIAKLEEVQANELLIGSLGSAVGVYNAEALSAARAAEAQLAAAAATTESTVASRALGSAMAFVGGPVGLAITAIGALGYAAYSYSQRAEEARQETEKWAQGAASSVPQSVSLTRQLQDDIRVMADHSASQKAQTSALQDAQVVRAKLMALGPEYRAALGKDVKSWEDVAAAIDKVNRADLARVKAEIAKAEAAKKAASPSDFSLGVIGMKGIFEGLDRSQMQAEVNAAYSKAKAPIEEELNALYASRAQLTEALAPAEQKVTQETQKHVDAVQALTKAQQRQADQNANYLARIESEASAQELNWVAMQRATEGYQKLTAAQKQEADILLSQIQLHKDQAEMRATEEKQLARLQDFRGISDVHAEAVAKQKKQIEETSAATVDLIQYLDQTSEGFRTIHELGSSLASDLENGFVAMAMGTKDAFAQMTQAILADLARLAAQKAFETLLDAGLHAIAPLFAGGGGDLQLPADVGGPTAFEPLAPVIPQGALRAPVAAAGAANITSPISIIINNDGSVSSETGGTGDQPVLTQRLSKLLQAASLRVIQKELQPGGTIYNVLGRRI